MLDDVEQSQQPQQEQQEQQPQEQPVVQEQPTVQQVREASKAENIRIMRERAEQAEKRALELERIIQTNMSQNQQGQKLQVEDDDDFGISDDDYIEGKHLKKYVRSLKQEVKNTKKQLEEWQQQSSITQAEVRLKSQFSDFDSVVSKENIEKLAEEKPVLYRTMLANKDIYDRGYTAYELIKNSGILAQDYSREDKRIEDNKIKPRSAANISPQSGETPLTRVGDYDRRILTEERKSQLRKQVEEARRNRS
jgi:hypothetical protein